MKYFLYKTIVFLFPKYVINIFQKSVVLKPIKDWIFDKNKAKNSNAFIKWNGFEFYFFANPKVLLKASRNGVESSLTRAMLKIIKTNANVIDIGSNYGFISLVMGTFVKDQGGTIFSFECDTEIYLSLQNSVKKNNLTNVRTYNLFLGAEDNENIRTVDSVLKNEMVNIDLIKIDTDGSDLDCLKGCLQIIDEYHPIVVIEINNNLENIIKYLKKRKYKYFYDQFFNSININKLNQKEIPNLIGSVDDFS